MTSPFRARLKALGLTGAAFARLLGDLAGQPPPYRTVERWTNDREPPVAAWALVTLLGRAPKVWGKPSTALGLHTPLPKRHIATR